MATPASKGKAINQRIQQEQKNRTNADKAKSNVQRQIGDGINKTKAKGK